ncbi:DNA/RNA nuclease SfsA [Thalassococcus sp. CAU 1522]|uniref:Sugar fermentation stimulation protein homolog n=1 Tax=Thalassococcus arenae TaxID=2851652 RepID=A0ABS6N5P6_9RHOB|nr:DNA/RNA nuclease SfsA [Thalassococcus arenae]MBV2358967.1 DNA/RNA nuclease SfsA [Thalassococcus arenae]
MRFQTELLPATLTRRYKRFLADCVLEDGREVTAHVANPGSMLGLAEPGMRIWLEPNDDPKKKLKFAWRLVDHGAGRFTGVDTGAANRVVRAALEAGRVPALEVFDSLRAEVPYAEKSRVDFLLGGARDIYVEVKSVTLSRRPGLAEFPDSVTARGLKHLGDLAAMVGQGHRAVLLFLVQRSDCDRVTVAGDIDPDYAAGLARAVAAGVEVMALGCQIDPRGIEAGGPLPVRL